MEYSFTKMQGCGNDYVYFSAFDQALPEYSELARKLSDRHFGVGGDGVIIACPSKIADAQMRMFNEDGSEGKMCGNGIRCIAKFLFDQGIVRKKTMQIETLSGIKTVALNFSGETVIGATVDMGKVILSPKEIPVCHDEDRMVDQSINVGGTEYKVTCVSMGNPHCVLFVDQTEHLPLEKIGPLFEHHSIFPDRVNTEFVRVIDDHHLQMRVWERGSGETMACGTGACASAVAAVLNGFCKKGEPITVSLLGGDLEICYTDDGVSMTGPATTVFSGIISL